MTATTRSGLQLPDMLRPALHRLLAEHGGGLPAGPVIGCLATCTTNCTAPGRTTPRKAMARSRLRQLAGDRAR